MGQEVINLTAAEAAEYGEFKRFKRETEISLSLKRLILDASRRETDRAVLRNVCESATKLGAEAVLVSPVNVSAARRALSGSRVKICCLAGGTGESLTVTKRAEAKRAVKQGAQEIRLVLCYYALYSGNLNYLKREIRKIRRAVRRSRLTVSLEDHSLGEEQVALAVRAACEAHADGVTVRGEIPLALRAIEVSGGKLNVDCSGVESSGQLRTLVKAGIARATTRNGESIAQEMYSAVEDGFTSVPSLEEN